MISLQECRKLLGGNSTLSDTALELLRDQLYALADITTSEFIEQRRENGSENPAEALNQLPIDERDEVEERAAILEIDAGMPRPQAERVAFIEHWRKRNQ